MTMYDPENPQHLAFLKQHRAALRPSMADDDHFAMLHTAVRSIAAEMELTVARMKAEASRQCPHGEPLGTCRDSVREHQEATR